MGTASVVSRWAKRANRCCPHSPPQSSTCRPIGPRYLMGVGDPASLIEAVGLGVDQFDCVMQTRLGRHGTALTSSGRFQAKAARNAELDEPLDLECPCEVCARHSRGLHPASASKSESRRRRGCCPFTIFRGPSISWTECAQLSIRAASSRCAAICLLCGDSISCRHD